MVDFEPIAISGAGIAAPLGHTPESVFEALCNGESAIAAIDRFPTDVFPVTSVPSSPTSRLVIGSVIAKT